MANLINLLAKLKVAQGATIQWDNTTTFPTNPEEGQLSFKEQILYIWATINNISTWFPLTTVRESYTHSQGAPASTWTVTHNLDTTNIIFIVYDENDDVAVVNRENVTNNSFTLPFTESIAGRCVVFASREADTLFKIGSMFERTSTGNDIIIYGNLIPSVDDSWDMGKLSHKWKDMYLSDATLYVGDTVTVTGNGLTVDPPASPTQASEQSLYTSSKFNFTKYDYNDGAAQTINPSIVFDSKLEIGTGAAPQDVTVDAGAASGKLLITASNFSVDAAGTVAYSGVMGFSQVDGGTWS